MGRFREGGEVVFPRTVADELSFIHGEVYGIEFRVGVRGLSAYIHTYIHIYVCIYGSTLEKEKRSWSPARSPMNSVLSTEKSMDRDRRSAHTQHTHTHQTYIHTYIHTYVYMGRFRKGGEVVFPRTVADELSFIHGEVYGQEFRVGVGRRFASYIDTYICMYVWV